MSEAKYCSDIMWPLERNWWKKFYTQAVTHSVVDTTVWGIVNWIRQPDKVKNNANEKGSGEGTSLLLWEGEGFALLP